MYAVLYAENKSYIENSTNKHLESYKERHFTWLDAFYDLIVAIIVFELSRELNEDVSVFGFLSFVALFVPAGWCDFLFNKICYR
jgi:low temperature requirement protein LtrA